MKCFNCSTISTKLLSSICSINSNLTSLKSLSLILLKSSVSKTLQILSSNLFFINLAGMPATILYGSTFLVTNEPAAMTAPLTYSHAAHYCSSRSYPNIIFNQNRTFTKEVFPNKRGCGDLSYIMISTKNKFCISSY